MSKLIAIPPNPQPRRRIKGTLFGKPGAGKTMLALSFPAPYYMDVEGGATGAQYQEALAASGGAYVPKDQCLPEQVLEQMRALATERHGFKTLVIDSVTKLFQNAVAAEQERLSLAGKVDAFGASKKPALAMMRRLIFLADRLDMNVWLIAHETAEYVHVGEERKEVGKVPDAWEKLAYETELVLQVTRAGAARKVRVCGKSRVAEFPEGSVHDADFAAFASLMGGTLSRDAEPQAELASDAQVQEMDHLLTVLAIPASAIVARLAEAKAQTWSEAPAAYVAACIEKLKAAKAKRDGQ